jgi:hypothetical protein
VVNGIKSFLGILNTAVITVLFGLHMERTIGFENLVPHIQSFFRGETAQHPKEDIDEYGHHSATENASVHDETAFYEIILPDENGNWQETGGHDSEEYFFTTDPDIPIEMVQAVFEAGDSEEVMMEFFGEPKLITEQNEYWNRCQLMYENVVVATRVRAAMIPQLEMAEYSNTIEVSHQFHNECLWPIQEVVTVAGMTASGRVVAPVGISGVRQNRSKNHVVLTFHLVEPTETHVYVDQVLDYQYEKNLLLSSSQRLENASQGYLACLSLIKDELEQEALSHGLLESTVSNTEDYIRELEEIRIGDLRIDILVIWDSGLVQFPADTDNTITDFTMSQDFVASVRN